MPAFGSITTVQVIQSAVTRLQALRRALEDCDEMNNWLAGLDITDVATVATLSDDDAGTLKSAFADAAALAQLYGRGDAASDGTLPGSYALPYTFGASQRIVLGPS